MTAQTITPTVVVRFYSGDGQAHRYRAEHVDTAGLYVTAVCQEDRFYPERHDPEMVSRDDLPEPGPTEGCPGCAVWARRNRHTERVCGRLA
jgi:hypothetical protein